MFGAPGSRAVMSRMAGVGGGDHFPDPFLDVASLFMPTNQRSALYWAEYIGSLDGTYNMAMERILSYFLTELEVIDAKSDDEEEKWLSFANDTLKMMTVAQSAGHDRLIYGNGFYSLQVPIRRFLRCRKCKTTAFTVKEVFNNPQVFNFEWRMPEFVATCPACKYRGAWLVEDQVDDEETTIRIKRWSPHEIELLHDPYTDDVAYLWRIPEDYKRLVRQGNLFHLERVSKTVLDAINKNVLYRFDPEVIFHMKEPTLAGIINRGWGIPRLLTNFRQVFYVQVLRRFNEAIALDYVIPFRVITPAPRQGSSLAGGKMLDPLLVGGGSDFNAAVRGMIQRRRRDPAGFNILPFPVQFQMFGADANTLAPVELLNQGLEVLLNNTGTPVEMYKGTLQLQNAPVALRLFESLWRPLVSDINAFLNWLVQQISQVLSWEPVKLKLRKATIADDLETRMMEAQLMMSQMMSGTTFFKGVGLNFRKEQEQIAREAKMQSEVQARTQEEMEQSGFAQQMAKGQMGGAAAGGAAGGAGQPQQGGGQPQQGGAPPWQGSAMSGPVTEYLAASGPNVPKSPQDILAAADNIAQALATAPEPQRRSELNKLRATNEVMHAQVKTKIEKIRRGIRTQAGNAALSQPQG